MHWASNYIGIPWNAQGTGPDCFNCWSFVRFVQRVHFSRELPEIPNPELLLTMVREFQSNPERRRWSLVETGAEGDCVLLRQARYPVHVGIWLETDGGGVLHCARGPGVVFQRPTSLLQEGWFVEGIYRFSGGDGVV